MEDDLEPKIPKLSLQSKNQLNFGIEYANKISKLKVFIYGLRGVSFFIIINNNNIVRSRNFKEFNIIRSDSINLI